MVLLFNYPAGNISSTVATHRRSSPCVSPFFSPPLIVDRHPVSLLSSLRHSSSILATLSQGLAANSLHYGRTQLNLLLEARMNVVQMPATISPSVVLGQPNIISSLDNTCRVQLRHQTAIQSTRRNIMLFGGSSLTIMILSSVCMPSMALAAEKNSKEEEDDDKGVIGAIESLFDPNEKTKSGKLLPKAYLKSAKEVVKTLRESLNEDPKNNAQFRRTADAAKESIRDYLLNWRGQPNITSEESYVMLVKAIRALAGFYKKAGPSAPMPEDVKLKILDDLSSAEESF